MDRIDHEEFKGGEESIEDWLDVLEAKMEAMDIKTDARKIRWCKARIGSMGLQILKGLEPIGSWDQAKEELKGYFGDDDTADTAWRNLEFYHAGAKSLGEIAADIAKSARKASMENSTQQRLAVRTFIKAIPRKIGAKLREKRIPTLKRALEEAKYLQMVQEEENREEYIHATHTNQREGNRGQNSQAERNESKPQRPKENRGRRMQEIECWTCKRRGHYARECPLWKEFMESVKNRRPMNPPQGEPENPTYQLNW